MTRRMPQDQVASDQRLGVKKRQRLLSESTGPDRNYLLSYTIQSLDGPAEAFGVGDVQAVRDIVQCLRAFGPKRRLHGAVASIEVEEHDDVDAWRWRPMPDNDDGARIAMVGTLRPPYWDRTQRVITYAPVDWAA